MGVPWMYCYWYLRHQPVSLSLITPSHVGPLNVLLLISETPASQSIPDYIHQAMWVPCMYCYWYLRHQPVSLSLITYTKPWGSLECTATDIWDTSQSVYPWLHTPSHVGPLYVLLLISETPASQSIPDYIHQTMWVPWMYCYWYLRQQPVSLSLITYTKPCGSIECTAIDIWDTSQSVYPWLHTPSHGGPLNVLLLISETPASQSIPDYIHQAMGVPWMYCYWYLRQQPVSLSLITYTKPWGSLECTATDIWDSSQSVYPWLHTPSHGGPLNVQLLISLNPL